MDLQGWKKLSRNEKANMWNLLTEAEKDAINKHGPRSRSHSRGHRHSSAAGSHSAISLMRETFSNAWMPNTLRTIGILAFFGGIICHFVQPESLGGDGLFAPGLLMLALLGITSVGIASILDRLDAISEQTRSTEARLNRLDEHLRQKPQNGNSGFEN